MRCVCQCYRNYSNRGFVLVFKDMVLYGRNPLQRFFTRDPSGSYEFREGRIQLRDNKAIGTERALGKVSALEWNLLVQTDYDVLQFVVERDESE